MIVILERSRFVTKESSQFFPSIKITQSDFSVVSPLILITTKYTIITLDLNLHASFIQSEIVFIKHLGQYLSQNNHRELFMQINYDDDDDSDNDDSLIL